MLDLPLSVVLSAASLLLALVSVVLVAALLARTRALPEAVSRTLEEKHLAMVRDLNTGLTSLGDRLTGSQNEILDRLRTTLTQELTQTRSTMGALQVQQVEELSANRETLT